MTAGGVHEPRRLFGDDVRRWQFWLGLAISLVFLAVAARNLQWAEVVRTLGEARYGWLIPGVAAYFVGLGIRAWRWHYLLRPLGRFPTRDLFPIVTIGYFGNNVFPARAGEILRIVLLKREKAVSLSAGLATILVERAFDGIVMLGFVFLDLRQLAVLGRGSSAGSGVQTLALVGAVVFLGASLVFLLLALFPVRAGGLARRAIDRLVPSRFHGRAADLFDQFLIGLRALRSPVDVGMVLLTSIGIWLMETVKYWFVMHAFPFTVSFFALMLMNGIVNLATTLPSAPGYVGTFDAPGIAVLQAYGVPADVAAGYTFVLHAALWLPVTLLGGWYMVRTGLDLRTARMSVRQEEAG